MQLRYAGKTLRPLRDCSLHSHDAWELVYNEKGCGTIQLGEVVYPFDYGSIFLYSPGICHKKVSPDTFEDYYISFNNLDLAPGVYHFSDSEDKKFFLLIRLLYLCYCNNGADAICDSLLDGMKGLVKAQLSSNVMIDKNVQQLRQRIIDRFSDAEFRIQEAMEEVPMNKDYLRRRFRAAYGMTPQDYLMQLRIENAKRMLTQVSGEGFGVAEVAFLSGFYDPLYFSRAFKKYTGAAPSAWKAR